MTDVIMLIKIIHIMWVIFLFCASIFLSNSSQ
nr:MAG TPA: hypothetical protein [Bacteriophage sp.]